MKNIFKGAIFLAACLALAGCGTNNYGEMTIQSINEPAATQQTVGQPVVTAVAETTLGTVKASGTEGWFETVATEPGDSEPVTEAYTGVTFPETMDDREQSYIIERLFYIDLPEYIEHFDDSGANYENGRDNYSKCNEIYKKFLTERLLDDPDAFEVFGGAYWCDGYMHMLITDWEKTDDVFVTVLAELNNGNVKSCDYSYYDLHRVRETVMQNEKVNLHFINVGKNRVEVGGEFTEEDIEKLRADIEAAGLDPNAAEFSFVEDCPVVNPL